MLSNTRFPFTGDEKTNCFADVPAGAGTSTGGLRYVLATTRPEPGKSEARRDAVEGAYVAIL